MEVSTDGPDQTESKEGCKSAPLLIESAEEVENKDAISDRRKGWRRRSAFQGVVEGQRWTAGLQPNSQHPCVIQELSVQPQPLTLVTTV